MIKVERKKLSSSALRAKNIYQDQANFVGVVCAKDDFKTIERKLLSLNVFLLWIPFDEIVGRDWVTTKKVKGLIIIEKNKGKLGECFFAKYKKFFTSIPVLFLQNDISDKKAQKLYSQGIDMVLDLKRESRKIGSLVAQTLGFYSVKSKLSSVDKSLSKVITAHLRSLKPIYSKLSVKATQGSVKIAGSVSELWKISEIKHYVEGIPGVKLIDLQDLNVIASAVSNKKLTTSISRVIESQPFLDKRTLSFSVIGGKISLAGKCISFSSMQKLIDLLEHIPGVRGIENYVVVSPEKYRKEVLRASRLNKNIELLFPKEKIEISVFGDNICVRGNCRTIKEKKEIIDYLRERSNVSKVVDKVIVK